MSENFQAAQARVLHVLGDSKFGGGSIIVLRLAEMADQEGYEVDVLTTDTLLQQVLADHGIGVIDLDVIWRRISPARDMVGLVRLWRFLRRNGYDLVHTHTSKAGFVGRLAACAARIPRIVHTVHGFAFHEESGRVQIRVYALLERVAALACHRIVTVSEYHRRWAWRWASAARRRSSPFPTAFPMERVNPRRDREEVRHELGLSPDTLLLVCSGRLAPQKGIEYLIRAVPRLGKRLLVPFRVVVVGTGPLDPELRSLSANLGVSDKVRFLGFRNDLGDLLAASDVVVLPSLWEGLSIAHARGDSDPSIETGLADELHAAWLRNSCTGRAADAVVLVEDAEGLLGFVTCKLQRDTREYLGRLVGTIVLGATATRARGKGVGHAATMAALGWFRRQGADIVEVGTQSRNITASRLFQRCGFRHISSSISLRKIL